MPCLKNVKTIRNGWQKLLSICLKLMQLRLSGAKTVFGSINRMLKQKNHASAIITVV